MRRTVDLPEPDGPISVTFSPWRDLEIEAVEDRQRAEPLGDVLEADDRLSSQGDPAFRQGPFHEVDAGRADEGQGRKIRPTMESGTRYSKVRSPIMLARASMSSTVTTESTGVSLSIETR